MNEVEASVHSKRSSLPTRPGRTSVVATTGRRPVGSRATWWLLATAVVLNGSHAWARPFRPAMMPNGSTIGCAACHVSPQGGGARNAFGADVFAIVKGPSATAFWGPELAAKDSDGDGFTNGEELGDPEGDGVATAGWKATNPGNASSKPAATATLAVNLTNPSNNASFVEPASFDLVAAPTAGANPIASVEFRDGATSLGVVTAAPWTLKVSALSAGQHSFTAEVKDTTGASKTSSPVLVTVLTPEAAKITAVEGTGLGLKVEWEGGTPPFLVQKKGRLSDAEWADVATTEYRMIVIPQDTGAGFVRVQSFAQKTVVPFTVWMNGAAEKPAAVTTAAAAFGSLILADGKLRVHVTFDGLSANASAAHIHGPAVSTNSAGVMVPFVNVPASTSGVLEGSYDVSGLSTEQLDALKRGKTYLNIHTANHPGGEIRGQVAPVLWDASLTGGSELPNPVTTPGSGEGDFWLIGNQLTYDIDYADLSAAATAAHLHGPSDGSTNAGVLVPFAPEGALGTTGAFAGTATLTQDQLGYFVDGLTYVNVHTSTNPGGEIRGQAAP